MACSFNLASVHDVCCATLLGYVGFNFQHFQSYHVGSQLNDKDSFAVFLLWSYSFSLEANGVDGSQLSMMENILWHHFDPRSNWILVLSHASDSERSITLAFYLTTRRGARMNVWLLGQTGITFSFEFFPGYIFTQVFLSLWTQFSPSSQTLRSSLHVHVTMVTTHVV